MKSNYKAVDFFCSGGGMTSGFRKAGINVLGGIDIDPLCEKTYTVNNPGSKFILEDIKKLSFSTLENNLKVKKNDNKMIFIGCSPCQYWSKIRTDKTKSQETRNLLVDFQKFVDYFKPGFIVIENVPGILNRPESPLKDFLLFLDKHGYHYKKDTINASHYGVPQTRRRFLLIASRVTDKVSLPIADTKDKLPTVRQFIGDKKKFKSIPAGHKDESEYLHTASGISDNNLQRLKLTPHNGGTRFAWSRTKLQIPAYVKKDNCFQDVYGRMFWDKPGPTLTTKFYSITNGRFAHPEQDRAISIREGARLQTFDLDYKFYFNSVATAARIIGNAVPPELSKRIATSIQRMINPEKYQANYLFTRTNDLEPFTFEGMVVVKDYKETTPVQMTWQFQENHYYTQNRDETPKVSEGQELYEGGVSQITSDKHERNPLARRLCIEHYGAICNICGFDFNKIYGVLGEGFIHVHHIIPLSGTPQQHTIDPIKDLIPVCPNCHAMIHRKKVPLSVDELKALLNR